MKKTVCLRCCAYSGNARKIAAYLIFMIFTFVIYDFSRVVKEKD